MIRLLSLLGLLALAGSVAAQPTLADGFFLERVASGDTTASRQAGSFETPTVAVGTPDGRMFVAEQRGLVHVVAEGQRLPRPFLDLRDEVLHDADRGLLGLALDPDFAANGHVYLYCVVDIAGGDIHRTSAFARLTRYTASLSDPNVADEASRRVLLGETFSTGVPACDFSHNGGQIAFGADGTLLLSTGDGASYHEVDAGGLYHDACFGPGRLDPSEDIGAFRALRLESLAGKVLRLDPETGLGLPSNPFYTGDPANTRSKVWAYGLRNPYRFGVAPGGSTDPAAGRPGPLLLGEIGWLTWEELNVAHGGENFGWPCYEGPLPHEGYQQATPATNGCDVLPPITPPASYWHHGDPSLSHPAGRTAFAIMGGDVYRGRAYPARFHGAFFYAGLVTGWLAAAPLDADGQLREEEIVGEGLPYITDISYDAATETLLLTSAFTGTVYRLRYRTASDNRPPVAVASALPLEGEAPLTVAFSGEASSDPDGHAVSFSWVLGDGATASEPTLTHTYTTPGVYSARVTVTDSLGAVDSTTVVVHVAEPVPGVFEITRVFPNPSSGALTLRLAVDRPSRITIGVYDGRGRRVLTRTLDAEPGFRTLRLPLAALASGPYLVRAEQESGRSATRRVMLLR